MKHGTRQVGGALRRCLCIVATALIPGLSWAAAACVAPEGGMGGTGAPTRNGGIGGTGAPAPHGGIGGTGAPQPAENGGTGGIGGTGSPLPPGHGGIGGTGQQANGGVGGTGIVDIVTGFGSVCVDGLDVQYDRTTPVEQNGLPALPDRLALGQVIAIEAAGQDGTLQARHITILEALAGPTTSVAVDKGLLQVMGQTVMITGETRLVGIGRLDELAAGVPLHVSGYRDSADHVVASRIEVELGMTGASAIGPISRMGEAVGGVAISPLSAVPATGTEVLVRGTWDGRQLHVDNVQPDPTLPFFGRVDKVVLEGLVLGHGEAGHLRISGFDVRYSSATGTIGGIIGQSLPGQRVRVTGRLGAGRHLEAEHIEILPAGLGNHATRRDPGAAKADGQAGSSSAHTSLGIMAAPLGVSQRMLPIIRPTQGMPTPSRGLTR